MKSVRVEQTLRLLFCDIYDEDLRIVLSELFDLNFVCKSPDIAD